MAGACNERDIGIATDWAGTGVYFFGEFNGAVLSVGHLSVANSADGKWDIFLVKLRASDGSVVWLKRFGGSENDRAGAVLAANQVWITGSVRAN